MITDKYKMNQEKLQLWLKALRSGEFNQTNHSLKNNIDNGKVGYCCLGVASELYCKSPEGIQNGAEFVFVENSWEDNSWKFRSEDDVQEAVLPEEVFRWLFDIEKGVYMDYNKQLSMLELLDGSLITYHNDGYIDYDITQKNFNQIADILEREFG